MNHRYVNFRKTCPFCKVEYEKLHGHSTIACGTDQIRARDIEVADARKESGQLAEEIEKIWVAATVQDPNPNITKCLVPVHGDVWWTTKRALELARKVKKL